MREARVGDPGSREAKKAWKDWGDSEGKRTGMPQDRKIHFEKERLGDGRG